MTDRESDVNPPASEVEMNELETGQDRECLVFIIKERISTGKRKVLFPCSLQSCRKPGVSGVQCT